MKSIFDMHLVIKAASRTEGEKKTWSPSLLGQLIKRIFCCEMVRGSLGKTRALLCFSVPFLLFALIFKATACFQAARAASDLCHKFFLSTNLAHCHCHLTDIVTSAPPSNNQKSLPSPSNEKNKLVFLYQGNTMQHF